MGGTADFGYDIIYGSYIVGGASSCSVQVTGVQAKANCSLWLSCNHSRADPWHVFIVYLFKDICLPISFQLFLVGTLQLDLDLPRGCCIGEMLVLVSMWYEGPGKQKTPVNKSCYSF